MPDLIIRPEAGSTNRLILQDQAGNAVLTTADSGADLAKSSFPSGAVVQTVHASFAGTKTHDTSSGSSYDASHLTKDIVITAGNSIRWTFQFGIRCWAGVSGQDYFFVGLYVYHKEDGGTFANAYNHYIGSFYKDRSGNIEDQYNKDLAYNLTGIHTPSSGTHHHYKLYYQFSLGGQFTIGVDTNQQQQFVILEEIQA